MKLSKCLSEKNLLIVALIITSITFIAQILADWWWSYERLTYLLNFYFRCRIFMLSASMLMLLMSLFKINTQNNKKIHLKFKSNWTQSLLKLLVVVCLVIYLYYPWDLYWNLFAADISFDSSLLFQHISLLLATLILAILIYLAWEKPIDNSVCLNCGAKYSLGQKFCTKCGNKL